MSIDLDFRCIHKNYLIIDKSLGYVSSFLSAYLGMFIILRRAGSKVIRLVVLIEALHVAHHQVLLEACHV